MKDLRNPRVTILFTPEELSILEQLEEHYQELTTSDIIKGALRFVNSRNPKPALNNIVTNKTTGKVDTTTIIFNEIMKANIRYGNKKSNIFINDGEKMIYLYLCRAFTYGESVMVKCSSNRWQMIQKVKSEKPDFDIQIVLAYKLWEETDYRLFCSNFSEVPSEMMKEGKNGVYFYTNKITSEQIENSKKVLGNRYEKILRVLNKNIAD